MFTLLNPRLENSDFEKRRQACYQMLSQCNIESNDKELETLVLAANYIMMQGRGKAFETLSKLGLDIRGLRFR